MHGQQLCCLLHPAACSWCTAQLHFLLNCDMCLCPATAGLPPTTSTAGVWADDTSFLYCGIFEQVVVCPSLFSCNKGSTREQYWSVRAV
jgi:hypothetical protein